MGLEAASTARQIFGGNRLSRKFPNERLRRDARTTMTAMTEDGCNDVLSLVGAAKL